VDEDERKFWHVRRVGGIGSLCASQSAPQHIGNLLPATHFVNATVTQMRKECDAPLLSQQAQQCSAQWPFLFGRAAKERS
jgi:hypothetical protein